MPRIQLQSVTRRRLEIGSSWGVLRVLKRNLPLMRRQMKQRRPSNCLNSSLPRESAMTHLRCITRTCRSSLTCSWIKRSSARFTRSYPESSGSWRPFPPYAEFAAGYERGLNQIVYAQLAADLDTPVSLMLKLSAAGENSFMLESVTGGEIRGRYSIVGMDPDVIWQCRDGVARIKELTGSGGPAWSTEPGDALASLRKLIENSRIALARRTSLEFSWSLRLPGI